MKLGKFLIPLALLLAAAAALWLRKQTPPEFSVTSTRIVPKVQPSLAVGLYSG